MEMNAYISYIIYPLIYEFIGWPLCKKHFKYIRFVVPPPPKRHPGKREKHLNLWHMAMSQNSGALRKPKKQRQWIYVNVPSNPPIMVTKGLDPSTKKNIEGILATQLLLLPHQPQPQWDCRQQSPPGKWVWWWLPVPTHLIWIPKKQVN